MTQARLLLWLLAVGTVFGSGVYTGYRWQAGVVNEMRLEAARAETERAAAAAFASEAAREAEQARVDAVDAVSKAYERGKADGKAAADNVFAGIADGTYVLRDKFRCPARSGASPAAPGTSSGDGGEGAVLSPADVQFLVRFASEADDAVRQLAAAQAVIRVDRGEQP